MFEPKNTDYWCYKFIDSSEILYRVDKFEGDGNQLINYLITNRNMSIDEARSFRNKIVKI